MVQRGQDGTADSIEQQTSLPDVQTSEGRQHGDTEGDGPDPEGEKAPDVDVDAMLEKARSRRRQEIEDILRDSAKDIELYDTLDTAGLDFDLIENIVDIQADHKVLDNLVPHVAPLASQLKSYFHRCGLQMAPRRDQHFGINVQEDAYKGQWGDLSFFENRKMQPDASVYIGIILDSSGSMSQGSKFKLGQLFALALGLGTRGVRGVDGDVWAFTDKAIYSCGKPQELRISGLPGPNNGNNDSAGLFHASRVAKRSNKLLKILVMISDGLPTECTWESLNGLANRLEQEGFIVIQIAVDNIQKPAIQKNFINLTGIELGQAVIEFGRIIVSYVARYS